MPPPVTSDVVVIGGGPAGATAARLLAEWGRSVLLLTRPPARLVDLGESLPPSTRKLLDHVGALEAVAAAGFLPTSGNTVWWESRDPRVEPFASGQSGFQVSKRALEQLLLGEAARGGVRVRADQRVRAVEAQSDGTRLVRADDGDTPRTYSARWVLDASGRAGVVARHGWRRPGPEEGAGAGAGAGARTLALIATWTRAEGWDVPDPSHTLVESYAGGWAWSVPVTLTRRYVTVMVDPRHTDLSGERDAIGERYTRELGQTRQFRRLVETAVRDGPPWACDASPYTADRVGAPGLVLVGDAASFIDPLSSFGVKKALASAWLAAVVTNTGLAYPDRTSAALALYGERERAMVDAATRQSAAYARAAAAEHDHPFWTDRGDAADVETASAPLDVRALRADPAVLRAFEDLKRRDTIDLAPGPSHRVEPRPTVEGRYVEQRDHLVLDGEPVRFLRDVDLPALVTLAPHHRRVPDLFEAYNRTHPPIPLPDFLGALSVLVARKGLVHRAPV